MKPFPDPPRVLQTAVLLDINDGEAAYFIEKGCAEMGVHALRYQSLYGVRDYYRMNSGDIKAILLSPFGEMRYGFEACVRDLLAMGLPEERLLIWDSCTWPGQMENLLKQFPKTQAISGIPAAKESIRVLLATT